MANAVFYEYGVGDKVFSVEKPYAKLCFVQKWKVTDVYIRISREGDLMIDYGVFDTMNELFVWDAIIPEEQLFHTESEAQCHCDRINKEDE